MTTSLATTTKGFEWRILLGPTHNWKAPDREFHKGDMSSAEQCELCGEPLDHGKPFMTNSAGQYPVHIACSGEGSTAAIGTRAAPKTGTFRAELRRWLTAFSRSLAPRSHVCEFCPGVPRPRESPAPHLDFRATRGKF
jgi:hypothetical protein